MKVALYNLTTTTQYGGVESFVWEVARGLGQRGADVTELRVSGGDTRLTSWGRIKADVIGVPVATIPGDAAVGGVAMLAGLGAGIYASVDDAIRSAVHVGSALEPDPSAHELYTERFAAWRELASARAVRRGA